LRLTITKGYNQANYINDLDNVQGPAPRFEPSDKSYFIMTTIDNKKKLYNP